MALAAIDAEAQSRRQDANHRPPSVERKKDDFDARIPFDMPDARIAAVVPASGDYRIDALLSGYKLPSTTVTYSFYSNVVFGGSYYGSESVSEVSDAVKTNVRAIMAFDEPVGRLHHFERDRPGRQRLCRGQWHSDICAG